MATYVEPVLQMRGQAGERQIPNPPKVAMHRGQGSWQSTSITILRTVEGVNDEVKPADPTYKPLPYVKMFYDALSEGKFIGMKCPECGNVEFPLYPICNKCGHMDNEVVELSGNVTVKELYKMMPTMTPAELAPYAPCFACEAQLEEGSEFVSLIFGVTPDTYEALRDSVPFPGKLVPMPDPLGNGYNTFAISINGAVPIPRAGGAKMSKEQELLKAGKLNELGDMDN